MTDNECKECNGTRKKRVGPDQNGRFYRLDCECNRTPRTATQSLTEPRSCREKIMWASMNDPIVSQAISMQHYNNWTWEETLEFLAVALIENRKHLMDEVTKLTMAMPISMIFKEGD